MINILLADDHALLVDTLEAHLRKLGDVRIHKAFTWTQVFGVMADATVDLALLDLQMPGMAGIEALREFRSRYPSVPVAVLSGDVRPEAERAVLASGVAGFIPKTIGGRAVLHVVQKILAGERYAATELSWGNADIAAPAGPSGPAQGLGGALKKLSAREVEVLRLLLAGKSNKEIGRALGVEVVTVTTHLGNVYRKLGVANRTLAVKVAFELGLAAAPEDRHS